MGEPRVDLNVEGGQMVKVQLYKDFFWSQQLQGMNLNTQAGDDQKYATTDDVFTIIDTGSSHLFLPGSFAKNVIVEIMKQAGNPHFAIIAGLVFTEC